jgi:hypothetical protein
MRLTAVLFVPLLLAGISISGCEETTNRSGDRGATPLDAWHDVGSSDKAHTLTDSQTDSSPTDSSPTDSSQSQTDSGQPDSSQPDAGCNDKLLWFADHETGDLSQYTAGGTYGGSFDSDCVRPSNGVVSAPQPVLRGKYAMKMTAPIAASKPGCRQFRYEESTDGHSSSANGKKLPLYYSLWLRFPAFYQVKDWTNVIQFKAKTFDKSKNDAFWVLELRNRKDSSGKDSMYFALRYKGLYPGPTSGEGTGLKLYHHGKLDVTVPADKWFNLIIFLSQSTNTVGQKSNYDGKLVVWQDGDEIYNKDKIATRYPDSWNEWSVNVYAPTNGIAVGGSNADFVVYVDDVKISDQPIGCP